MANYYYVTIKSDKMTQEIANKIFQEIASKNKIRNFSFNEGHLYFNTRGLPNISNILIENGFTNENIEIKDEFEYAYENMKTPDESVIDDLNKVLNSIELFKKRTIPTESMIKIEQDLNNIIKGK